MKQLWLLNRLMTAIIILAVSVAVADVPEMINYHGRLTKPNGQPVADGPYLIEFVIYDAPSNGSELWNSTYQTVQVADGLFEIRLGESPMPPISDTIFNASPDRWLGITVGTDSEIDPRTRFTSVGYAYQALRADTAMYVHDALPSGIIVMWSGAITDIPEGWALCDGTNGTPDLRDRFIKSIPDAATDPGSTGGTATHDHGAVTGAHTLTLDEMPSHSHQFWLLRHLGGGGCFPATPEAWDVFDPILVVTSEAGNNQPHSHAIASDPTANLPPYYEMAFIMKL